MKIILTSIESVIIAHNYFELTEFLSVGVMLACSLHTNNHPYFPRTKSNSRKNTINYHKF